MRIRTTAWRTGWRVVPATVAAGVLAFGIAGVASAQVNTAPTPQNDTATTNEDTPVTINVLLNDTDPDGNTLTLQSVANGSKGTTAINAGQVVYTPNANANGTDTFTYVVSDGALSASANVTVTITPVNDAPVAVADSVTVTKDTPKVITVLANDSDVDGDALTVASVSIPGHGTAVITDGTKVTYTPTAGYTGTDTFTYVVTDGALTAASTVNITVKASTFTGGTSDKVKAACETYASLDGGLTALCRLYLSEQLPRWAQENIGNVILRRVGEFNKAEVICATTSTDPNITALCTIYNNPASPAWLKKEMGKVIEQYVKASSSVEVEKDKSKDKDKSKTKTKGHSKSWSKGWHR